MDHVQHLRSRTDKEWAAEISLKVSDVKDCKETPPNTGFASISRPEDELFPYAIDHTLLKPDATPAQIDELCEQAIKFTFKVRFLILFCQDVHAYNL